MASFNERPQTGGPENFLGYSRGIDSDFKNDSLGQLFSHVAEFGGKAVVAQDTANKDELRDQLYEAADSVGAEFGVLDATTMQSDVNKEPLPTEVSSAGENLDRLKAQWESGALQESHYWARLNSITRQLRAKYPGYRTEIDDMVSEITGGKPANRLRDALMSEWNSAASEQSEYDNLVERLALNTSFGLPADFDLRASEGKPYTRDELISWAGRKSTYIADQTRRSNAIDMAAKEGTYNETMAKRHYTTAAISSVNDALADTSGSLGALYADLQDDFQFLLDAQGSAKGPADWGAQLEQLKAHTAQLSTSLSAQLDAIVRQTLPESGASFAQYLTEDQIKQIKAVAMAPVVNIQNALANEQWGILQANLNWIKASTSDLSREMLTDIPFADMMTSANDLFGPNGVDWVYGLLPAQSQGDFQNALVDYVTANRFADPSHSVTDTMKFGTDNDQGPQFYQSAIIDQWKTIADQIGSPDTPLDVVGREVDFMFGEKALNIWGQFDTNADAVRYYTQVTSPVVTQKMLALKAQGDLESWEKYRMWTLTGFTRLFQTDIQTLQQVPSAAFAALNVGWDEGVQRFTVTETGENIPGISTVDINLAKESMTRLNTFLRTIDPILKDEGGDTKIVVKQLLESMGFDAASQQSFPDMMLGMVDFLMGDAEGTDESTDGVPGR